MKRISRLIPLAILLSLAFAVILLSPTYAANDPAPNWQLIEPLYESSSTLIAAYSAPEHGIVGVGITDVTGKLQSLLDALGRLGGGTLFLPEGKYVVQGNLVLPKGVTLRGEWAKPIKGQPVQGTVLMAYAGRNDAEAPAFVTMETSSGIRDLSIWYPEQLPDDIVPYPPSVLLGRPNVWGNENCNVTNLTFVNAYSGIVFSHSNGGTSPVIQNIYGTPLSQGIEIDNIVDVGRIDWVDFSPAYWAGSGLPGSPNRGESYEQWIYENGTGIIMRRNDWSYTSYVSIEGYGIGYHAAHSIATPGAVPNGHHYDLHIKDAKTGILFDGVSGVGIMFTNIKIEHSVNGIVASSEQEGALQLYGCSIEASEKAIYSSSASLTKLMMRQCDITSGEVAIDGGTLIASDNDFNNQSPHVSLGEESRAILTSNRFNGDPLIDNRSKYISIIDHTPVTYKQLPPFPVMSPQTHKPKRQALYVVTDAPFQAKGDGKTDNTKAIQRALDTAGDEGGGVVFLPPGKYKVLGRLVVPAGVELKGSLDNGSVPTGPGSIIQVYADRDNPNGEPFLKLAQGSGVRGLVFDYPEQQMPKVSSYPYLMQSLGSDVYIINIGMRGVYNGIDLFSHRSDRHYVDYAAGHVFHNGVTAGGGSQDGIISNLQFNPLPYAAGQESKYGSWPSSPAKDEDFQAIYDYGYNELDFLTLGNVSNQILYNVFHFGSERGLLLTEENGIGPSGISLGLGVDGAKRSVVIEKTGAQGFDFINTQLVTIGAAEDRRYIETGTGFDGEVTFFSSDHWGAPVNSIVLENGTVNMLLPHFESAGEHGFSNVKDGELRINNAFIRGAHPLFNAGKEAQVTVQSSIADSLGIQWRNNPLWQHNLANLKIIAPKPQATPAGQPEQEQNPLPEETAAASATEPESAGSAPYGIIAAVVAAIAAAALGLTLWLRKRRKQQADKPNL